MKNLRNRMLLLFVCISVSILEFNAQEPLSKGLTAKVDGKEWKSDEKNSSAIWNDQDGILTIIATRGNEKIRIVLQSSLLYEVGIPKGSYFFGLEAIMLDDYFAGARYIKGDHEWTNNDKEDQTPGEVEITEITPTRVKGKFNFDLTKKKFLSNEKDRFTYDETNIISITDGSFDLPLTSE